MSEKNILSITNIEPKEKLKHPPVQHPFLPQHAFSMLIVAPKGSGKTNFICNLILKQYKGYFHRIVVCSPTLENDNKWEVVKETKGVLAQNKKLEKILEGRSNHQKRWKVVFPNKGKEEQKPDESKFDGKIDEDDMFSEQHKIFNVIEEQQNVIEFLNDNDYKKEAKFISDRVLIILDDQAGLFKMSNSNNPMVNFVLKHRHHNTSIIFVTQAYKAIPKSIRTNMNVLILFEIPNSSELKVVYEEYPDRLKEEDWIDLYWEIIDDEPYSFMYMNNHFPKGERIFKRFEHKYFISHTKSSKRKYEEIEEKSNNEDNGGERESKDRK
jgi:hypothetical protein